MAAADDNVIQNFLCDDDTERLKSQEVSHFTGVDSNRWHNTKFNSENFGKLSSLGLVDTQMCSPLRLIYVFYPLEEIFALIITEKSRSNTFQMLGRLSSNSRLSFESHNGKHSLSHQYSAADSGSDLLRLQGFLQAHFHTSGTGSTFAAPSISIEPTICLVL